MPKLPSIGYLFPFIKSSWLTMALLLNFVTWTYMIKSLIRTFLIILDITYSQVFAYEAVFHLSTSVFLIFGGFLAGKVERFRALVGWTVIGGFTTFLPVFLGTVTNGAIAVLCLVWGASIGGAMPFFLAYFSDVISVENRGRASGLTLFITYLTFYSIATVVRPLNQGINSAIFSIWRFCGLIPLLYMRRKMVKNKGKTQVQLSSIIYNSVFIRYFVPWLIFCLVDTTEQPIIMAFFGMDFFIIMEQIELVVGGVFTILGGFLLDFIGRKRMIIFAFVAIGMGYAILSLSMVMPSSWLLYAIVDGIAWGILTPTFMLTLWGDISKSGAREMYFAIGTTAVSLGGVAKAILTPELGQIPIYGAFSIACLFLFLATIPLLYVPETLPEKVLKRRGLIKYIKRAKTISERMRG